MKRIVLTGGGTAGHVTPNIALLPRLKALGYEIDYIGSTDGMERGLIEKEGIPYYPIACGKLRRYFNLRNFTDPFRVIKGYGQALKILKQQKPDVVFSKGGFVSVPVVIAAHFLHIPAILHESDLTPGLANKICGRFASRFCCNFPETLACLPAGKAVLSGTPIRSELRNGNAAKALQLCGFGDDKPVILVMGGSLGSVKINEAVRNILPQLTTRYQVIHLCGKEKCDPAYDHIPGYRQFEYISEELPDLFAAAQIILSRAGANAICEFLALKKPNILIPLSKNASRGDQILNARSFEKQNFSKVIEEEELTPQLLLQTIDDLYQNRDFYIQQMARAKAADAITIITDEIEALCKK